METDGDGSVPSNSFNFKSAMERDEQDKNSLPFDDDQRVYLVPFRWWKDAQDPAVMEPIKGIPYTASPSSPYGGPMKILNNMFNSDLSFNLRKDDYSLLDDGSGEVGVSGRNYALVPGEMWLQTLKWHSGSRNSSEERKGFSASNEDMSDVYPLQLRLSVPQESSVLAVKINKKDNSVECVKRACRIFDFETEPLRIWDFSGQTTLLFLNEKNKILKESQKQTEQDILFELQVYGLSDSVTNKGAKKDENGQYPNGISCKMNGTSGSNGCHSGRNKSFNFPGNSFEAGSLGLTGLQNLGNTCFMNSALQCLAHTPNLVDYFLGDYKKEINTDNPLGMNGEIALAFGDLMKKLWAPGANPVAPRTFKLKLAHFAPQFSGFNQHDSQEVLAFLLDGLHEDLNRVKCKPYIEAKDSDDRADEELSDEYWRNHLARNDSIIVDVCQGQYRSKLVCPYCKKLSVTFDPFMYLSLPLPSTFMRTMTLTVMKAHGSDKPSPFTVTVPKNGSLLDLNRALSTACSLDADEMLLIAEIYNNCIIRFLEEPTDALSLLRDDDKLIAYRLPKEIEDPLLVFMHQKNEETLFCGKLTHNWRAFGVPLVVRKNILKGSDLHEAYTKLFAPFLIPDEEENVGTQDCSDNSTSSEIIMETDESSSNMNPALSGLESSNREGPCAASDSHFHFYLTDEKRNGKGCEILMEEAFVKQAPVPKVLYVLVSWPEKTAKRYDMKPLVTLPEVFKSGLFVRKPQEPVSLYKCLEAFLKEEPLGPDDMWFCPGCKKHCQASKKLDLWRLPEILVIHLKRFSYSRFLKNKLETFVDFPIRDLDLSSYIAPKGKHSPHGYMLYAISNHYGSMGGGHYTAFVRHGGDRWYDFDDTRVTPVSGGKIKTSAAYVLFYRRIGESL